MDRRVSRHQPQRRAREQVRGQDQRHPAGHLRADRLAEGARLPVVQGSPDGRRPPRLQGLRLLTRDGLRAVGLPVPRRPAGVLRHRPGQAARGDDLRGQEGAGQAEPVGRPLQRHHRVQLLRALHLRGPGRVRHRLRPARRAAHRQADREGHPLDQGHGQLRGVPQGVHAAIRPRPGRLHPGLRRGRAREERRHLAPVRQRLAQQARRWTSSEKTHLLLFQARPGR